MQEQELYKKYKNYFIESLSLLEDESGGGEKILSTVEDIIEFEEPGRVSCGYVQKNNYAMFVFKRWDLLKRMNSYIELSKYLNDKEYMSAAFQEQGFLINILLDFIRETNSFNFNEEKFESIYKGIEEYAFSEFLQFSCSAQMYNFSCDVDEIIIDKEITINRYTEEECKKIWGRGHFWGSRPRFPTNPNDFKIKVRFPKEKKSLTAGDNREKEAIVILKNVLTLLRLFKDYNLRIGPIEVASEQWLPSMSLHISGEHEAMPVGQYKLNSSEQGALRELWGKIQRMNLTNVYSLEIALKRFNFVHERIDSEDKLIDIMIGIETLFSESNDEIRYKTSLRTSLLIGKGLEDRKKIFKIMQKAYDLRSKLVHGEQLVATIRVPAPVDLEFPIGEFINFIKNYFADSIKSFINLSQNYNQQQIFDRLHDMSLSKDFTEF